MTDFDDLVDGGRALVPLISGRVGVEDTLVLGVVPNGTPAAIEVGRTLRLPVRGIGIDRDAAAIRDIRLPRLDGFGHLVVVDDAVESGTAAVAIGHAVRSASSARLTLAVPVCPTDALPLLDSLFDEVVAAVRPTVWRSLSTHYAHFCPVEVDDALTHLAELAAEQSDPAGQ